MRSKYKTSFIVLLNPDFFGLFLSSPSYYHRYKKTTLYWLGLAEIDGTVLNKWNKFWRAIEHLWKLIQVASMVNKIRVKVIVMFWSITIRDFLKIISNFAQHVLLESKVKSLLKILNKKDSLKALWSKCITKVQTSEGSDRARIINHALGKLSCNAFHNCTLQRSSWRCAPAKVGVAGSRLAPCNDHWLASLT